MSKLFVRLYQNSYWKEKVFWVQSQKKNKIKSNKPQSRDVLLASLELDFVSNLACSGIR